MFCKHRIRTLRHHSESVIHVPNSHQPYRRLDFRTGNYASAGKHFLHHYAEEINQWTDGKRHPQDIESTASEPGGGISSEVVYTLQRAAVWAQKLH